MYGSLDPGNEDSHRRHMRTVLSSGDVYEKFKVIKP